MHISAGALCAACEVLTVRSRLGHGVPACLNRTPCEPAGAGRQPVSGRGHRQVQRSSGTGMPPGTGAGRSTLPSQYLCSPNWQGGQRVSSETGRLGCAGPFTGRLAARRGFRRGTRRRRPFRRRTGRGAPLCARAGGRCCRMGRRVALRAGLFRGLLDRLYARPCWRLHSVGHAPGRSHGAGVFAYAIGPYYPIPPPGVAMARGG